MIPNHSEYLILLTFQILILLGVRTKINICKNLIECSMFLHQGMTHSKWQITWQFWKIFFIFLISTFIHVCITDYTLYSPDPHAEFPCSTIRKSSNCENGGKKCWEDTNQNGKPELLHSSQNWEFPAAYSGHRPWVIPWYSWNIQTAVVNHTFVSGASQTYLNTCLFDAN